MLHHRTLAPNSRAANRRKLLAMVAIAIATVMVVSCTKLIGPKIVVAPGSGRSQPAFDADRRGCMSATDRVVQPMANDLNLDGLARNSAQIDADNARIQKAYDADFSRCMTDKGHVVQASPPALAPSPDEEISNASDGAILTDADSQAAKLLVAQDVRELRQACPGDLIRVDAHAAPISQVVTARLVVVWEPRGGVCMGAKPEVDYLIAKGKRGWSLLLSGIIRIRESVHAGVRDVQVAGTGANCSYDYQWDGNRYVKVHAGDCPFDSGAATGGSLN